MTPIPQESKIDMDSVFFSGQSNILNLKDFYKYGHETFLNMVYCLDCL